MLQHLQTTASSAEQAAWDLCIIAGNTTHVKVILWGPKEVGSWVVWRILSPELWHPTPMLPAKIEEFNMIVSSVHPRNVRRRGS